MILQNFGNGGTAYGVPPLMAGGNAMLRWCAPLTWKLMSWWELTILPFSPPLCFFFSPAAVGCLWRVGSSMLLLDLQLLLFW